MNQEIGVVIIGRNEGERFKCCLTSVLQETSRIIYVDSGSTDGSVQFAKRQEVLVMELDLKIPFTAARARNEGFKSLIENYPEVQYVQFLDGDCELVSGWINEAGEVLKSRGDVAVVCGRRRELYPEASVYNQLCDVEWDTPVGEAPACGGDSMMRIKAFSQAGGFNPSLIAGEEPELCVRLRRDKWKILRIDREMTRHDAALTYFSQWWKRTVRSGHAYGEVSRLCAKSAEKFWTREVKSILFWGAILPSVIGFGSIFLGGWILILLSAYFVLGLKIYRTQRKRNIQPSLSLFYAFFTTLGKFAQFFGVITWIKNRLLKRSAKLIEYKVSKSDSLAATKG